MADSWQETTSQQVKLIADRLNELLSSGVDILQSSLGVDLGLQPDLVPPWVILLAACLGLVLMVALWASACRGLFRKKTATITALGDGSEGKRAVSKPSRNEEPKKKKRKTTEKKVQPNGRLVAESPEEEVQPVEDVVPHHPPAAQTKADRAVEVKKAKKKSKQAVKEVKTAAADGKEPEEGTWETKVSNKGKREQRRKEKTPGDGSGSPGGSRADGSGSPGGARGDGSGSPRGVRGEGSGSPRGARGGEPSPLLEATKAAASVPVAQKKKKGEPAKVTAETAEATPAVDSGEAVEVPAGWTDLSIKAPADDIGSAPDSWAANQSAAPVTAESASVWGQETEGSWTVIDATGLSFTELGEGTPAAEPLSVPSLSLTPEPVQPLVEDEWSGPSVQSADPSSDWNAPTEAWVNEEVTPLADAPPPQEEQPPVAAKLSDEEKEKEKTDSPPDGSGKSKKKRKKKKKQAEDGGVAGQDGEEPEPEGEVVAAVKEQPVPEAASAPAPPAAQEVVQIPPSITPVPPNPAETELGANANLPASSQPEEKPSKTVKKKKARRET